MAAAPFVADCRRTLDNAGCRVVDLDLVVCSLDEVERQLAQAAVAFVTGGYPLYLLERAAATGFLGVVASRVRSGDLAYTGVSAGAALAGPDMSPLAGADDPGRPGGFACLGLVDFVPIPHANRHPRADFAARQRAFPHLELRPLRDDEALVVDGASVATVPQGVDRL
jgi:dipeptidase E